MEIRKKDKFGDLILIEEISAESDPINNFQLVDALSSTPENASSSPGSLSATAESSDSPSRRKRGRPSHPTQKWTLSRLRLNPDRAARHKRNLSVEYYDEEELVTSTNAEKNSKRVSKKAQKKRNFCNQTCNDPPRQKGRPKKEAQKPTCVVKPMQPVGVDNKQRNCNWNGCSFVTNAVRTLKAHVEREHLHHLSQFVCRWDNCARVAPFKALYMLTLHLRSHIGDKPFECRICGKCYTRQENLRTHTRTHNNERPFRCSICQKSFRSSSDRVKHQNRTHSDEKKYKCPGYDCIKAYKDPSSLRKHMVTVHGAEFYEQAKLNKQQNGPGSNYGIINLTAPPTPYVDLSNQPSTSRGIEVL